MAKFILVTSESVGAIYINVDHIESVHSHTDDEQLSVIVLHSPYDYQDCYEVKEPVSEIMAQIFKYGSSS